jgi:hypothetical protein
MMGNDLQVKFIISELQKQREQIYLKEIKRLVDCGILVETIGEGFVQSYIVPQDGTTRYEYIQSVKFEVKEKEYIEKIEMENKILRVKNEQAMAACETVMDILK